MSRPRRASPMTLLVRRLVNLKSYCCWLTCNDRTQPTKPEPTVVRFSILIKSKCPPTNSSRYRRTDAATLPWRACDTIDSVLEVRLRSVAQQVNALNCHLTDSREVEDSNLARGTSRTTKPFISRFREMMAGVFF